MGKPLKISEEAAVQMPMKTVASLICMVAIGTWAYFGIIETQNKIQTTVELMQKDLVEHDHPVEHSHTTTLINKKEIELLKVQIEEIKVKSSNPLAN